MTILFISHYSGFYGAAKSLLALMVDLRDRFGVKPLVLLPSKGALCEELDKVGISYKTSFYYWWVNYNHGWFQFLLNKRKQLINFLKIKRLCRLFPEEKIDLIYTNSICVNVGMFMARRMRVPHIWQFRESLTQFNLSLPLSLSLFLLNNSVNRYYVLISDYMCDFYSRYLPSDRIVRIYNGVAIPDKVRRENLLKENVLNLCIVGVITEQKNQLEAVKAMAILRNRGYKKVMLHLIGFISESYGQSLNRTIEFNDLQDAVRFYGNNNNVHQLLDEMNVGLMCSRDEAFGRATVEYMQHRMPVIASLSGANAEIVDNNINGFTYELGNANALADLIERFVLNPDLLKTMGDCAFLKSQQFSLRVNTDAIFEIINNIVEKS